MEKRANPNPGRDRARGVAGRTAALSKLILSLFIFAAWTGRAWAYVDPGTSGAVFSSLGYIIGMVTVAAGFLFRPVRKLLAWMRTKIRSDKDRTAA